MAVRRALGITGAALDAAFVVTVVVLADLGQTVAGRTSDRVRAVPRALAIALGIERRRAAAA